MLARVKAVAAAKVNAVASVVNAGNVAAKAVAASAKVSVAKRAKAAKVVASHAKTVR